MFNRARSRSADCYVLTFDSDTDISGIGLSITEGTLERNDVEVFGDYTFEIIATDKSEKNASISIELSLNRRPQLTGELPQLIIEVEEQANFDLKEYFTDDLGQTIMFALVDNEHSGVVLNNESILTVSMPSSGDYNITIDTSDNLGAINRATISVSVSEPSQPTSPSVSPPNNSSSPGGSMSAFFLFALLLVFINASLRTEKPRRRTQ